MTDRRAQLLKLLAEIDQQIGEAESLAADIDLDETDRHRAAEQLAELRAALDKLNFMLGER